MYIQRFLVTLLFSTLMFQSSFSASVPYKNVKDLENDSYVNNNPGNSACPGGKASDVMIYLDLSKYLTKEEFNVQLQRAEHMVRLFRNFKTNDRKYNRISIFAVSENRVHTIVKFKKNGKIGTMYTEELANTIRKLHKNREYDNTITSHKRHEIHALRHLWKISHKLRRHVAHVAFYFSADDSVSKTDLKRAHKIKKRGIYLYILRLRASRIRFDEYKAMVSSPVTDFVFEAKDHSKIDSSVKKLLNMEHCNMQVFPGYTVPKPICEARRPVNLYLGVERNSLQSLYNSSIFKFYKLLKLEIKNTNANKIQTQLIFSEFSNKKENISEAFIEIFGKTMKAAINNANKDSQKTLLLFVSSTTPLTSEMIKEAAILKNQKIEVYVVVEGKSETDFSKIASKPAEDHLFIVPYFKKLSGHKDTILKSICKGW
ncbi:uncharacterized protein LOC115218013 [Octopus sinensis]|uniref:Uncharacterized protein LOC115218013 n=1 Tax=Octopus sinensis TaxID=2607531 RepID=A0A6P7SYY5_9MOLL|nr:uncharacterized protein LOC115218013 [Octopus sinensis]